jgi:hypothetical protein
MFWLGREPESEASYVIARTTDSERAAEMQWILAYIHYRRGDLTKAISGIQEALRDSEIPEIWRERHKSLLSMVLPAGSLLAIFLAGGQQADAEPLEREDTLGRVLEAVSEVPKLATLHRLLFDDTMSTMRGLDRLDATLNTVRQPAFPDVQPEQRPDPAASYWQGHWNDVLAELDTAIRNGPAIASYVLGPPGSLRLIHGVAALIAGHRGGPEEAQAHLRAAQDQPIVHPSDTGGLDFVLAASALVAEQRDRPMEALDLLATMLEPDYSALTNRFRWLPGLVRLAMELGERGRARFATLLCERSPGHETVALRCRALLDRDPEPMLQAAERYRSGGDRLEFAQTMEDAAVLLAGKDRLAEATATFRTALVSYDGMGAAWDVRRAERRMRQFVLPPGPRSRG